MINSRSALRAKFTIAAVVISLFALIGGCEIQDLGITESAAPPQNEASLSVSSQSSVPANPPAWSADITYNAKGYYVTHKGSVWVSQWSTYPGSGARGEYLERLEAGDSAAEVDRCFHISLLQFRHQRER